LSSTYSIDGRYITHNLFNAYKLAKRSIGEKTTAGVYPPANALYREVFHPPGLIITNLSLDTIKQISANEPKIELYGLGGEIELKEVSNPVVGQMVDFLVRDESTSS